MWFSVVCTLIDNDMRHHSGQNFLRTHSAAPHESTTFMPGEVIVVSFNDRKIKTYVPLFTFAGWFILDLVAFVT